MMILKKRLAAIFMVGAALLFTSASPAFSKNEIEKFFEAREMVQDQVTVRTQSGEEMLFNVEIAVTPAQKSNGLQNRTHLDTDAGMLFLFNMPQELAFWMKDTLIPLDMLFISPDGTIGHIHHMAKPQDETRITSLKPAMAVLEINGGLSDKLGIQVGDSVLHPVFRNVLAE